MDFQIDKKLFNNYKAQFHQEYKRQKRRRKIDFYSLN